MFQAMLLSVAIAISFAIFSTEAFQPHRLIKTSVIKQGIKMSIAPPEFLELSNTLNVASFSVLPSSVLNTDLILSFAHENAPIVFWIVNVLIFNLAKGGQTYPIGPLALPEGTTVYPTLFNKLRWFFSGQVFAVAILLGGLTGIIGFPFAEVPELQSFINYILFPLGLVAGIGHSLWVWKRFNGAQIGRVSNVGSCTVAQSFFTLLFSFDWITKANEQIALGSFEKLDQAILATNFVTIANFCIVGIILLRFAFLVYSKLDSVKFEENFMGIAEE